MVYSSMAYSTISYSIKMCRSMIITTPCSRPACRAACRQSVRQGLRSEPYCWKFCIPVRGISKATRSPYHCELIDVCVSFTNSTAIHVHIYGNIGAARVRSHTARYSRSISPALNPSSYILIPIGLSQAIMGTIRELCARESQFK